jgi:hypothetical protein
MSTAVRVMRRFLVENVCADCGEILNTSNVFENLEALREAWTMLALSSGLVTRSCPKGCRATFSDCNINTRFVLRDADTKEVINLKHTRLADLSPWREEVV